MCLTKTGNRIKIIDFGLARTYEPQKKLQVKITILFIIAEITTNLVNLNPLFGSESEAYI